jgi:lysyl-tRNA synthetase class 2
MTEELVARVAAETTGSTRVGEVDLAPPWQRIALTDAISEATGVDISVHTERDALAAAMEAAGVPAEPDASWGKLVDELFSKRVEPSLMRPTIVLDYPVELSPFAKPHRSKPGLVERFEAVVAGIEIANAFTELNDPDDQRARLEQQQRLLARGDEEAQPFDADYVFALEHGMPPTGGLGIGIDRLVMLLTERRSIREVLLFPALRDR